MMAIPIPEKIPSAKDQSVFSFSETTPHLSPYDEVTANETGIFT